MALFPLGLKAEDCDDEIEVMIAREAIKQGVSVDIAIAVAKVESGLIPTAKGKNGEIGLFQIMPYHSKENLWNLKTNIRIGIALLKYSQKSCENTMQKAWPVCYNQGSHRRPKHPELHPYYRKVQAAMQ